LYCRTEAKSGPDGSYELLLAPGQSYLVAVCDDAWAARSLRGLVVAEGQPRAGPDLHLLRGTRLHGRVRVGPRGQPATEQTITLLEQGGDLPEDLRGHFEREELVRWARTDAAGTYEFRLGPGRYLLWGPALGLPEELVLQAEEEVVRDFLLQHPSRGPLTGQVRRSGQAVRDAVVRGEGVVLGHAGFAAVGDGKGCFAGERWRERMLVYARDPQGDHAGWAEVGELDEAVTVEVGPAATARGRVVDPEGAPLPNEAVSCRMRLPLADATPVTFQIEVRTDLEGVFVIPGLPVGSAGDVRVFRGDGPCGEPVAFAVQAAGGVGLPGLIVQG
jgi:hypothetical protein